VCFVVGVVCLFCFVVRGLIAYEPLFSQTAILTLQQVVGSDLKATDLEVGVVTTKNPK